MLQCKIPDYPLQSFTNRIFRWIVDGEDQVIYANRAWREQTQLHDEIPMASDWIKAVAPESRATVEKAWKRVVEEKCPQVFEAQLTSPKAATDNAASEKTPKLRWILCSAFPEVGEGGTLESVWACNTDIRCDDSDASSELC